MSNITILERRLRIARFVANYIKMELDELSEADLDEKVLDALNTLEEFPSCSDLLRQAVRIASEEVVV